MTRDPADEPFLSPLMRFLLIALLLATAFGVRAYRITEPPLDFAVPRQFRTAINARAYYYSMVQGVAEWKTRNAQLAHEQQGTLGPPGMAVLTAAAYCLAGGEKLWIPRTISILAWIIGGFLVWATARRFCNELVRQ